MKTKGKLFASLLVLTLLCSIVGFNGMFANAEESKCTLTTMKDDYTVTSTTLTDIKAVRTWGTDVWGAQFVEAPVERDIETLNGEKDGDKAGKVTFKLFGFTAGKTVNFSNSVLISDIDSVTFRVYVDLMNNKTSYTYDESDWAGIWLFGVGATGSENEGYKIPVESFNQREWVDVVVKGDDVLKLADGNGKFSGFQIGSIFFYDVVCWESYLAVDEVSYIKKVAGEEPEQDPYLLFDSLDKTTVKANTLTKVGGKTQNEIETMIGGPVANYGIRDYNSSDIEGSLDGKIAAMNPGFWGYTYYKTINFKKKILASEVGTITLRMYIDLNSNGDYSDTAGLSAYAGVWFYGDEQQGLDGEGYHLPVGLEQRKWIEVVVPNGGVKALADSDGYIGGIQIATLFVSGIPEPYASRVIAIDSISYAKKEETDMDKITVVANGNSSLVDGTLTMANGFAGLPEGYGNDNLFNGLGFTRVSAETDTGAAFRMGIHTWAANASSNVIKFDKSVTLDSDHALAIRIYAHLSPSNFYNVENGGLIIYGDKQIGEKNTGYAIPNGVVYKKLTSFVVEFEFGDGRNNTLVTVDSGDYRVEKPENPTREGYDFVGWYTINGELYDFDKTVYNGMTLEAKWKIKENNSSSAGTYSGDNATKGCGSLMESSLITSALVMGIVAIMTVKRKKND